MTAPTVLSEAWTTPSASNSTTYAVTVPTGSAGDVIECEVVSTSNAALSTSSTGWAFVQQWKFSATLSMALFRKKVGTTGADSLTVTSASTARYNAHTARYPVGTRSYASYAGATATSTNSNPPLVDHKKSRDILYAAMRAGAGTVVPSVAPTGYGTVQNNAATSGGVSLSYGRKTATSSSDDPGTFTSSSAAWGCTTIARWIDTTGPLLSASKALCQSSPATPVLVGAFGTSFTAGTKNDGAGVDTLAGNIIATARPAVWASGFTALPAKHFLLGTAGLVTPTATAMHDADNRFSADSSFAATDSFSLFTMGRAGWGFTTAGHKATIALGFAFDRVRVRLLGDPTLTTYTIDVDGGTPQTITVNQTAGYQAQTFSLTGTSSSVIHVTASTGGAAVILGVEAWTNGSPQVSIFNVGWSSGNSNDMVANIAGNAALGLNLTVLETWLNDSVAGISLEQSLENSRQLALTAFVTGEAMFSVFPYVGASGTEASEDAIHVPYMDMAETLGCAWFDVRGYGNFTSRAAELSAGYFGAGSNHPLVAGYGAWGAFERGAIDPGPLTATGTASITETSDTSTATGSSIVAGAVSATEASDTVIASAKVAVAAAGAITEASDTTTATGAAIVAGAASLTEAPDTASATGVSIIGAAASITEDADTVTATGTAPASGAGSASITEADDTASATGAALVQGSLSVTEESDTTTAVGQLPIGGVASGIEASDTLTATGSVLALGAATISEEADTLTATGVGVASPIVGAAAIQEADDTIAATATVRVQGAIVATEADDTTTATAAVTVQGAAAATEDSDTAQGAGVSTIQASATIYEDSDLAAAAGFSVIRGGLAATEASDTLMATAQVGQLLPPALARMVFASAVSRVINLTATTRIVAAGG